MTDRRRIIAELTASVADLDSPAFQNALEAAFDAGMAAGLRPVEPDRGEATSAAGSINLAHHRNGVMGEPFDVLLFADDGPDGSSKVAVVFDAARHVAVLDVDKLAASDIAFGSNSWRGDNFEPTLRAMIQQQRDAET